MRRLRKQTERIVWAFLDDPLEAAGRMHRGPKMDLEREFCVHQNRRMEVDLTKSFGSVKHSCRTAAKAARQAVPRYANCKLVVQRVGCDEFMVIMTKYQSARVTTCEAALVMCFSCIVLGSCRFIH